MRRIHTSVLPRLRSEDGFGLIEAMVALAVLFGTTLAMVSMAAASLGPTALARQRQTATGLADQAMEEIRALPFDTLKRGLDNVDLAKTTDPNIVKNCGGVPGAYCFGPENIPHGTSANVVPLVPHQHTTTVRAVPFTVSTYVTYYQNDSTTSTFRITVIVSWTSPEVRRVSQVMIQTIANSPAGCLSTATHPFSAPCQPFLYANAVQDQGGVVISGTIDQVSLDHASLWDTSDSDNLTLEQISTVQSNVLSSGVDLQLTDGSLQLVGKTTTSASADSDPSEPANDYQSVSAPNETSGTLTASNDGNSLAVSSGGSDSGTTISTTSAATPTPSHPCPDPSGVSQNDLLPCGSSSMKEGSSTSPAMKAILTLNEGSANLGAATLASVAAAPTPGIAYVNRDIPSGDGVVHAETKRYLGTITLAGLPANVTAPTGWLGYLVKVTSFTDDVVAEAGTNAGVPTATASGTISYWNGTGYSSLTIAAGAAVSIPVAAVHLTQGQVTVDIVPTLSTGGTILTDPAGCAGACTRTQATAKSMSPIVGNITYSVRNNGTSLCNLNLAVDFGAITSKTNYQAAPNG
jgi:hypothetical protein